MPSSSDYPVAGVRIVADTSDYDSAIRQIIASAARLDAETVTVNVTADTSSAKSDLLALDSYVDESQTVNVTADTTDAKSDLSVIQDQLSNLQSLAVIQLVLDAAQFIAQFESLPIISQLAATDSALASIEARTGAALEGLDGVINRIYVETGAERGTIADALVPLIQDGETSLAVLEELGTSAIEFSQVFGTDVNQTLKAANTLIGTGLADNATEAFDVLIYGMQSGANSAGDFLDLVGEFGDDFAALGLTGQDMVDLTVASLDAGAQNAGRYGEAINGLRQNFDAMGEETVGVLTEAGVDPENFGLEGLRLLNNHLIDIEDQAERTAAMTATFGSGGVEIGERLTFVLPDATETQDSIEGTADEMNAALDDSLTEAIREAGATLETTFIEALDNALDISGFLDKITEGAQEFADLIQQGVDIGEAAEIAFGIEGLDEFITRFESAFGNIVISILELVASIRDLQGLGSEGVRAEIARLAAPQLAFDLGAVGTEEIAGVLATGIERGLEGDALQASLSTAVSEAIAAGEPERAQAIVDAAAALRPITVSEGGLFGAGMSVTATPLVNTDTLQEQVDAAAAREAIVIPVRLTNERLEDRDASEVLPAFREVVPTADLLSQFDALNARIDVAEQVLTTRGRVGETVGAIERTGEQLGPISPTAIEDAATATALAGSDFEATLMAMTLMAEDSSLSVEEAMQSVEDAMTNMGDTTTEVIQGNTVIEDFELMAASALETEPLVTGAVGGMEQAFVSLGSVATREMDSIIGKLMELQSGFTTFFGDLGNLNNLSNIITSSTTTVNANIVNNNQSNAQAVSANQQVATTIRGVTS